MAVISYKVDPATIVYGGNGNDDLVGGPGADLFDCGPGRDIVKDFNATEGDVHLANCEMITDDND